MSAILSVFIYVIILFGLSTLLFTILDVIWSTGEPAILYMLTLIFTHLFLSNLDRISRDR